jgi:hypothetical protein
MATTFLPMPSSVERFERLSLVLGGVFLLITAVLTLLDPAQGARAWLFAFLFWVAVALGCLSLCLLHNLTGGLWGLVIRRPLEAASLTFPALAVLFVGVALGLKVLYVWADPAAVAKDALLQHKALYLNVPFFIVRAVFYFAVWTALAQVSSRWSRQLDAGPDLKVERRQRSLGGGGLVLLGLTMTFASIDWGMSLNPHWFSTIWGVMFMVGAVLSALCLMIVLLAPLAQEAPFDKVVRPGAVHDLGKLMLAFTMLWAYVNLSQLVIIWSGNMAEETPFYVRRLHGGWQVLATILLLFHFVLPFLLLLSRDLKRNARALAGLAGAMLLMRLVDLYWLLGPDLAGHGHGEGHGGGFHLLYLTAPLGLGGLWLFAFFRNLKQGPILPIGDPDIQAQLAAPAAEAGAH